MQIKTKTFYNPLRNFTAGGQLEKFFENSWPFFSRSKGCKPGNHIFMGDDVVERKNALLIVASKPHKDQIKVAS